MAGVQAWAQSPRERVRYIGTTLSHRYALAVAEHFARETAAPRPIGEVTDARSAMRLFCAGAGTLHPDILIATQMLAPRDRDICAATGVTEVKVVPLGFDVIAMARPASAPPLALTREHLWKALAAKVPIAGVMRANSYRNWHEIDPTLPDEPIRILGPELGTGVQATLVDLAMLPVCLFDPVVASQPGFERQGLCSAIRTDGVYRALPRFGVLSAMQAEDGAFVGVLPYGLLAGQNTGFVPLDIDGRAISERTLAGGTYPLGRRLYLLYKPQHLALVPGVLDFAAGFLTDAASGPDGYLLMDGFMPWPDKVRQADLQRLRRGGS